MQNTLQFKAELAACSFDYLFLFKTPCKTSPLKLKKLHLNIKPWWLSTFPSYKRIGVSGLLVQVVMSSVWVTPESSNIFILLLLKCRNCANLHCPIWIWESWQTRSLSNRFSRCRAPRDRPFHWTDGYIKVKVRANTLLQTLNCSVACHYNGIHLSLLPTVSTSDGGKKIPIDRERGGLDLPSVFTAHFTASALPRGIIVKAAD